MIVTTLIENTCVTQRDDLAAEHGLSLHIRANGTEILFDTGAGGAFADNAARLDVQLDTVQAAVISHHHYDHGGGLARFFQANAQAPVYMRPAPQGDPQLRALLFMRRYIGLDRALLAEHAARIVPAEGFTQILPGVYLFTAMRDAYPKPKGNRYLYLNEDGRPRHDDFRHELILAIEERGELVIFTGCAHNGVLNMIDTVVSRFEGMPIKAVIGGFHLIGLKPFSKMAGSRADVTALARRRWSFR